MSGNNKVAFSIFKSRTAFCLLCSPLLPVVFFFLPCVTYSRCTVISTASWLLKFAKHYENECEHEKPYLAFPAIWVRSHNPSPNCATYCLCIIKSTALEYSTTINITFWWRWRSAWRTRTESIFLSACVKLNAGFKPDAGEMYVACGNVSSRGWVNFLETIQINPSSPQHHF